MNLTNYEKTPMFRVFEMVKREAARYGVSMLESEIVGLVPSAALVSLGRVLPAARAVQDDQILENKLANEKRSRARATSATSATTGSSYPAVALRSSSSTFRAGAMPNARILRYRLLRSTPSDVGRARDVALLRRERPQDVVALERARARRAAARHGAGARRLDAQRRRRGTTGRRRRWCRPAP